MNDLAVICPVCEKDVILLGRELKLAFSHRKMTGGNPLIGCPHCARVLRLPDEMVALKDDAELDQYVSSVENCCCVPMLDDDQIRKPAGTITEMNAKKYRPGGGGQALPKRLYMLRYGVDPEIAWAMNGPTQEPFKI